MLLLSSYFDSTLLKPEASSDAIVRLSEEAVREAFYAVCVNPCYVPLAHSVVKGSDVRVATVIGFPLGQNEAALKACETELAYKAGASEADMVLNIGALKEGRFEEVKQDIRGVAEVSASHGGLTKVILETCLLTDEEIRTACMIAEEAGADFVKTSTGFSTGGATEEAVRLMKETVGDRMKIKASGGIRDLDKALRMIECGADRLGCSACGAIMKEWRERNGL